MHVQALQSGMAGVRVHTVTERKHTFFRKLYCINTSMRRKNKWQTEGKLSIVYIITSIIHTGRIECYVTTRGTKENTQGIPWNTCLFKNSLSYKIIKDLGQLADFTLLSFHVTFENWSIPRLTTVLTIFNKNFTICNHQPQMGRFSSLSSFP
jgi:hypothetical protein